MITIKNLTKKYNGKYVYKDFNLTLPKGLTILIGSNGVGKSTLVKCITNQIAYKGEIVCNKIISYLPENRFFNRDVTCIDFISLVKDLINYDDNTLETFASTFNFNIDKRNKKDRIFICHLCNHFDHRDIVGATNILDKGMCSLEQSTHRNEIVPLRGCSNATA